MNYFREEMMLPFGKVTVAISSGWYSSGADPDFGLPSMLLLPNSGGLMWFQASLTCVLDTEMIRKTLVTVHAKNSPRLA
jgi:hypothetical protein